MILRRPPAPTSLARCGRPAAGPLNGYDSRDGAARSPVEVRVKVVPPSGADRAIALPVDGGHLVAVADGAGGTGGGAAAADRLIAGLSKLAAQAATTDWWQALLSLDEELSDRRGGETTGVVAFLAGDRVIGASVGDSAAWLISPAAELTDLTARQRRKPLIGSGEALPVEFEAEWRGGRLLLASDGLTKYAPPEQICSLAMKGAVVDALDALANCVRLPSGGLQDDVAVVLLG
jgi:serine/threonine protein phosphatase PrpC